MHLYHDEYTFSRWHVDTFACNSIRMSYIGVVRRTTTTRTSCVGHERTLNIAMTSSGREVVINLAGPLR